MERDGDLGNYLRFNFENAIEIIDKLTKDNNALLDKIEELENRLNKPITIKQEPIHKWGIIVKKETLYYPTN